MIGIAGNQTLFGPIDPFEKRRTTEVTFKGKLNLPIHRWYRLTPSFSPKLATDIAIHFGLTPEDYVLDPFSGVGTVPLCMKYEGIPACSIELNPYLHFVSTVKTRSYSNLSGITNGFEEFISSVAVEAEGLEDQAKAYEYLAANVRYVPPIHRPERWWSPVNLAQLVAIRKLMLRDNRSGYESDLLRMGILGVLIPTSNAKHNHVSLTFADEPAPAMNVLGMLREKLDEISRDLEAVRDRPVSDVKVYAGNSRSVSRVLPDELKVSAVITSPPYPNRFSYARETRPHLFFFDFVAGAQEVGQLETEAIGGTWGAATSSLSKGVEPANDLVRGLISPYTKDINGSGELMASYVTKYFNNIYEHVQSIEQVCRDNARLAYVIGNSKFYGHPLPSDEILAGIFAHFGFVLEGISKMRRRQSKSGLYEAVVFMRRG